MAKILQKQYEQVYRLISEERKRAYEQGVKEGIIDRGTLETKAQIPGSMFEAIKREGQEEILKDLYRIVGTKEAFKWIVEDYALSLGLTIKE